MAFVVYVPGLSRNLLSTRNLVEEWGKALLYYETKVVLGFPVEGSLLLTFVPARDFSTIGVRQTPNQGSALGLAAKSAETMRIKVTGQ